jgi:subtilisin family serine protease
MKKLLNILTILMLVFAYLLPLNTTDASELSSQRYIILFKEKIDDHLLESMEVVEHNRFESIHALTISATQEKIAVLKGHPSIQAIQEEQPVTLQRQIVDWGSLSVKADKLSSSSITGKGVKIAVLDTGIDKSHPDLRVVGGACFLANCINDFQDDNGHGTHVAGILAALNNGIGTVGVVPDASIYAVKVLDHKGFGTTTTVMEGVQWAIDNGIDIVNLSLSTDKEDLAMKVMMDKAYQQGVLIVAAAGNNGTVDGQNDSVEYPARYDSVIGVSSVNKNLVRIPESATGPTVEIAAPGFQIYSTFPTSIDNDGIKDGYGWMSGTSMATPFVSGILATYKQQFPTKTHMELRNMLQESALDIGEPGRDTWYGYGLVQANADITTGSPLIPGQDVFLTNSENGIVSFEVLEFPSETTAYNVYRDGALIGKNMTEKVFEEYLVKGNYLYQFSSVNVEGKESSLSAPVQVTVATPYFKDLTNKSWFTPHIVYLTANKIVTGYKDDTARPQVLVKRAEAVAMIGRALKLNEEKRVTVFKDVDSESFASGYIQSAYDAGILKGFPDKTFRPNQAVTRAEMAILISNAYDLLETGDKKFKDVTSTVTGHEAILKLATANITQGYSDGTFKPYDYMKRSDFSVFLARAENDRFK